MILLVVIHFGSRHYLSNVDSEGPIYLDSLSRQLSFGTEGRESAVYDTSALDTAGITQGAGELMVDTPEFNPKPPPDVVPVDLNRVDSLWLMKIYGIGPVLSKRIIKYRNLLGGFHSMDQLKEVYRLPPEVIETLSKRVFINNSHTPLEKIFINNSEYLQIAAHPYISFDQARAIVAYRKQHGPFNRAEDLKKIHLIDDSTYLRVRPYVDF